MDLIELQRKESRKVWIFCWLFVGACALTMVELYPADEEEDEITTCIEVLEDKESYEEDTVNYCRRFLTDVIKSRIQVTT